MVREDYVTWSDSKPMKKELNYYSYNKKKKNDKSENTINISTSIEINQSGDAQGIGGRGGDSGNATGGSVASAVADASSTASASVMNDTKVERNDYTDEEPSDLETIILEGESDITTFGGNATGGAGGIGGNGNGGTITNSAIVQVDTIVIISNEGNYPGTTYNLSLKEKNVDIKVDEKGNTYVNGKKMKEEEIGDGIKVFLFKSTDDEKASKN